MIDPRQKDILTFDCYGTLIDWERGILTALQPVLRAHGVAMDDEQLLEHYATFEAEAERGPYLTYREVLATCLRRFGEQMAFSPTANDIASFSSSVGDWPAFPDSAAALAALKRCFSLAVLTNMDDDLFALSNEKLGRPFATIITAQQLRSYKPAEANFHAALARLGAPRERVLHVAQSLFHDHVPAKRLGFDTVWVNRRHGRPGSGATPPATARPDLEAPDMQSVARILCPE